MSLQLYVMNIIHFTTLVSRFKYSSPVCLRLTSTLQKYSFLRKFIIYSLDLLLVHLAEVI